LLIKHLSDTRLAEMAHCTGTRLISYCNCGRRQMPRDEPFTIREANYSCYNRFSRDCCDRLERVEFPVFQPTQEVEKLSLQEMLQILQKKTDGNADRNICETVVEAHSNSPSQEMETELRQENILADADDGSESDSSQNEDVVVSECVREEKDLDDRVNVVEEIKANDQECGSNCIVQDSQSKSEYLPGMTHSKAPAGLLPLFSSWSLVCLGSSRYIF
jgi:protein SMG8